MPPMPPNRRRLAMLCLPLLVAATLACGGLSLPAIPTVQPTATLAPGQLPAVDPCSLLSADEARALVGQPVGLPHASGSACLYSDQPVGLDGVGVYAQPASQSQDFLGQYVAALQAGDPNLDQSLLAKLSSDSAAGDMPAAVNDLYLLTKGLSGYDIQQLDGVGTAALWSWRTDNQARTGALIAAKPGVLVALVLSRTSTTPEAASQAAMETIVKRILANLPANFTIAAPP